ncbi:TetR/AcrR family transcriptional regulator [Amycolatopsis rhabdoformis]|uniref:TetR/AcrR family transcriptional regulator n=1 Tax=Amycolatopsis rhabdoformis TaxID=1448059 RepID=A0ABZ1I727_9PSEU|nr:TetR/AcrR family transcriptional regulator [Amycolatopsis rhabdoformis]WSE29314.1 TetR/AcrR family transcriptional regulator [Amycolatopsis rhabdoformis]
MTQPGPRGRYGGRTAAERRAERRERLMTAGLELFGTAGYAASTVGQICREANLSTRQYYEEFADREALLIAVYDHVNAEAQAAVAESVKNTHGEPLTERIKAALTVYALTTATDLRRAKVAYVEIVGVSPGVEEHRMATRARWVELMQALLSTGIADGEIPDRDYRLASSAYIGAANGLLQDWCATPDRAPLADAVAELARISAALTG